MSLQSVWQKHFTFGRKDVVAEPIAAQLSSDAGLILFRELDERLGATEQFAAALVDAVLPDADHSVLAMTRMRVFGILADYEDQNDHDALRSDPLFKLISVGSTQAPDLASQPTLSRFENRVSPQDYLRLRGVFVDQFLDSFTTPPDRLTFDIDPYDDPAHGEQQLVFFDGPYDQYQYQVRLITCAENDMIVLFTLLYGSAAAALGIEDDLEYLIQRVRTRFPDVQIIIRADTGFASPEVYECCERLRTVYTIGMGMNPRLLRDSDDLLKQANGLYFLTQEPQRLFLSEKYAAGSWGCARDVVIKVEVTAEGVNRRAVVTNRPGVCLLPAATYEEYANRGESENRNKEMKLGLYGGRLSDHRYFANLFRVALHTLAHNLLVQMRRLVADPPSERPANTVVARNPELPVEALPQPQRRHWFNHRRREDPLGEGQIQTWRTRVIKVAAEVTESARRIVIRLSGSWPYLAHYEQISDCVLASAARSTG